LIFESVGVFSLLLGTLLALFYPFKG